MHAPPLEPLYERASQRLKESNDSTTTTFPRIWAVIIYTSCPSIVFSCLRAILKLETSVVKLEKKRGGPATSVVAEARGCNIKAIQRQKEWGNKATLSDVFVRQILSTVKSWQSDRLKKNLTEKHPEMRNKLPNCKTEKVLFFFSPRWKPCIKRQRYLHTEQNRYLSFLSNSHLWSKRSPWQPAWNRHESRAVGAGVYFPCITFQGVIREGEVWISSKWGFVKG